MIEFRIGTLDDVEANILIDFEGVLPITVEEDLDYTRDFNPFFYMWFEDDKLLGYMGIIETYDFFYCSYTKMYDRRIYRDGYNKLKSIKEYNKPLLVDADNNYAYKNHILPYKDTQLFVLDI